jgi:hypothetical protein
VERHIQEVQKGVRKLVADSMYSLEDTPYYAKIRRTAWLHYYNTPNFRSGGKSPNEVHGEDKPLYLTGMGAKLKFGTLIAFETPEQTPLGSMQARDECGVLLGPDEDQHGYKVLGIYKGQKHMQSRIMVATNMKGLQFKSHIIPGLAFNKMYSPEPDASQYTT